MTLDGPVPGVPDARVWSVTDLPEHLADAAPAGNFTEAKPGELLIALPAIGRFRVREGVSIEVAPAPGADPGAVELLLHGRARTALIHQRGELPLHAASLVPQGGNEAVAICGASGAGKSTLAAELSRRGWRLLADDTTRVTCAEGGPLAWPGRSSIKLWRDACEAAGLDADGLEQVTRTVTKYYVPALARAEPARLGWVFELSRSETGGGALATLPEKMALLSRHAASSVQIVPLGCASRHVQIVAEVAKACRVVRLAGARATSPTLLADAIEDAVLG
jgi:hypothetical protein